MEIRGADIDVGTGANWDWWIIFRFRMAFAYDRSARLEHSDRGSMNEHAEYDEEIVDGEDDFSEVLTIRSVGQVLERLRGPIECPDTWEVSQSLLTEVEGSPMGPK